MSCERLGKLLRRGITGACKAVMAGALIVAMAEQAGAVPARNPSGHAMVVRHDMGGSVRERMAQVALLSASATEVRIEGTCVSACTLFLGVPTVCVTPSARLGFHGPSTRNRGLPLPRAEFERISAEMASLYPPMIRSWFMTTARHVTGDYIVISGRDAIAMGVPACG